MQTTTFYEEACFKCHGTWKLWSWNDHYDAGSTLECIDCGYEPTNEEWFRYIEPIWEQQDKERQDREIAKLFSKEDYGVRS